MQRMLFPPAPSMGADAQKSQQQHRLAVARPPPLNATDGDDAAVDEGAVLHHLARQTGPDTELFCRMDISAGGASAAEATQHRGTPFAVGGGNSVLAAGTAAGHAGFQHISHTPGTVGRLHFAAGMTPGEAADAFAAVLHAHAAADESLSGEPRLSDQGVGSAADLLLAQLGSDDDDQLIRSMTSPVEHPAVAAHGMVAGCAGHNQQQHCNGLYGDKHLQQRQQLMFMQQQLRATSTACSPGPSSAPHPLRAVRGPPHTPRMWRWQWSFWGEGQAA